MTSGFRLTPVLLLGAVLFGSTCLTGVSLRERGLRSARQELARLGLEDVSRRVVNNVRNLETVRQMSDSVAISRANSFAQIIASDPSVLDESNRVRFEKLARDLDVDELHVSDEKGVLVRSFPSVYEGFCMASSPQSAPFMEGVTNKNFQLVQEPQARGCETGDRMTDETYIQYSGVARRDRPGIVQVGSFANRLVDAMRLADVGQIAATTRVGRDGRVSVEPLEPGYVPSAGAYSRTAADGRVSMVVEAACEGYLVTVEMPEPSPLLSRDDCCDTLIVVDLVVLLLILLSMPAMREVFAQNVQSLRTLFSPSTAIRTDSSLRRFVANPLLAVGLAVFALLTLIFWQISTVQATRTAKETLATAANDMVTELQDCVDALLYFQGDAICRHYKNPENMTHDDLDEIMRRYGLDELNVIDGKGIVIRGALADVGYDMASNPKSAEFNRLLDGETKTYSQRFRAPIENPCGVKRKYAGVAFDPPVRGYVQLGLSETRLKNRLDYFLKDIAESWHIGDTGYFVIAKTETGIIVSSGRDFEGRATLGGIGFDPGVADSTPDEAFEMTIDGERCLCRSGIVNRYHRYVAVMPLAEVHGGSRRTIAITVLILLVIILLAVAFMTRLSDLVSSLRSYIERDRERRERDLAVAKTIQSSSLPLSFPDTDTFKIFATMDTAREVGGDFYDFCSLESGKWLFLIADVSGKGIPAAMFMMKSKAIIRSCVFENADLAAAITDANNRLADQNDAEMFVTSWIGLFDPVTFEVTYVNAGHNPPLVKRADGKVEWVKCRPSLALAAMPGAKYRVNSLQLRPGDSLFLYTDGVTEAMNGAGELFGEARLEKALADSDAEYVSRISRELDAFVNGAEQSDDITMLALDLHSKTTRKDQ